jgi:hypothetical protein
MRCVPTRGLTVAAGFMLAALAFFAAARIPQPERGAEDGPSATARERLDRLARDLEGDALAINWEDREALIQHLRSLPQGDPLRVDAIDLARRYANPHVLGKPADGLVTHRRDHVRLDTAWAILLATEVLRPGMRFEDAVAVLGRPTSRYGGNAAKWYYTSPVHVNPALVIETQENEVSAIRQICS